MRDAEIGHLGVDVGGQNFRISSTLMTQHFLQTLKGTLTNWSRE